jgi:hypothetical protein
MTITAEFDPRQCFERTQNSLPTEQKKSNRKRKSDYAKQEPVPKWVSKQLQKVHAND